MWDTHTIMLCECKINIKFAVTFLVNIIHKDLLMYSLQVIVDNKGTQTQGMYQLSFHVYFKWQDLSPIPHKSIFRQLFCILEESIVVPVIKLINYKYPVLVI